MLRSLFLVCVGIFCFHPAFAQITRLLIGGDILDSGKTYVGYAAYGYNPCMVTDPTTGKCDLHKTKVLKGVATYINNSFQILTPADYAVRAAAFQVSCNAHIFEGDHYVSNIAEPFNDQLSKLTSGTVTQAVFRIPFTYSVIPYPTNNPTVHLIKIFEGAERVTLVSGDVSPQQEQQTKACTTPILNAVRGLNGLVVSAT